MTRRGLPWKRFPDMLRRPWRCGVRGYAEMHNATAFVAQYDEHEQELKRGGRHDEEIDRRQTAHMVPKEYPPGCDGGFGCRIMYLETAA